MSYMEFRNVKLWNLISDEKKKCEKCGVDLKNGIFDIHHKDGKRYNNQPENLEILCQPCHRGTPKESEIEPMIPMSYRLPGSLLKKIDEMAQLEHTTPSMIVRKILLEYIDG